MTRRTLLYGGAATLVVGAAWLAYNQRAPAVGQVTRDAIGDEVQTLPRGQWPVFAGTGETQQLYRYAVEHREDLNHIPCTCGCGRFGHTSNFDCYVKATNADGTLTFTSHAAT